MSVLYSAFVIWWYFNNLWQELLVLARLWCFHDSLTFWSARQVNGIFWDVSVILMISDETLPEVIRVSKVVFAILVIFIILYFLVVVRRNFQERFYNSRKRLIKMSIISGNNYWKFDNNVWPSKTVMLTVLKSTALVHVVG